MTSKERMKQINYFVVPGFNRIKNICDLDKNNYSQLENLNGDQIEKKAYDAIFKICNGSNLGKEIDSKGLGILYLSHLKLVAMKAMEKDGMGEFEYSIFNKSIKNSLELMKEEARSKNAS